jgi:hypothetical protein
MDTRLRICANCSARGNVGRIGDCFDAQVKDKDGHHERAADPTYPATRIDRDAVQLVEFTRRRSVLAPGLDEFVVGREPPPPCPYATKIVPSAAIATAEGL